MRTRKLSYSVYEDIVAKEADWWIKKRALIGLMVDDFGMPTYEMFLNARMREDGSEVARISATRLIEGSCKLAKPYGNVETTAKQILKAAKLIRFVGAPASRIAECIGYFLERRTTEYDWKRFFGTDHKNAERVAILLRRDKDSNIEKLIIHMDSWCDLLFENIYQRVKKGKKYPRYGAALDDPIFAQLLPLTIGAF